MNDFRGGWYYPGELLSIDPSGYLFIQGRTSDVIFRGGKKIFPGEVEAVLQTHDAIVDAAVLGRSGSDNEDYLIAYVTTGRPVSAGDLFAYCRSHLAPHKVPREINIVPELPRHSWGKVDKRALAKKLTEPPSL